MSDRVVMQFGFGVACGLFVRLFLFCFPGTILFYHAAEPVCRSNHLQGCFQINPLWSPGSAAGKLLCCSRVLRSLNPSASLGQSSWMKSQYLMAQSPGYVNMLPKQLLNNCQCLFRLCQGEVDFNTLHGGISIENKVNPSYYGCVSELQCLFLMSPIYCVPREWFLSIYTLLCSELVC